MTELLDAGRRKLLEGDWDLGVVVTDLPLKVGGRPVSRHLSPTHGLAVLSLPALGALHLRQRLRRALLELIGELTGGRRATWEDNVLRELTTDTARRPGGLASSTRRPCREPPSPAARDGSCEPAVAPRRTPLRSPRGGARRRGLQCRHLRRLAARRLHRLVAAPDHLRRLDRGHGGRDHRSTWPLGARARPARPRPGRPLQRDDDSDRRDRDRLPLSGAVRADPRRCRTPDRAGRVCVGARPSGDDHRLSGAGVVQPSFATVAGGLGAGLESREVVREAAYTSSVGDETALADGGTRAGLSREEDR